MIEKNPLIIDRIRKIQGSFAYIEHRFLRNGFFASLEHHELLLYLFLVLAADRKGLSYYSYDKICSLLAITVDEYILARDALIDKDLIAFNGFLFQVLSLPESPVLPESNVRNTQGDMAPEGLVVIGELIDKICGRKADG